MAKKIGINGVVRDMTPEEETAFDADCVVQNTKQEERKVAREAVNANKASAKAKLIAGEALTADEADTIVL